MNIRNILMVASLALSVLIGLVLARGGKTAGAGATTAAPLIGLSLDTLKEERWQNDRNLFVKKATELGAQVKVQSANSDDNQQIRDVESLLTAGVKVLVIVPHDGVAMARAVEMAHKVGVPVVAYDRLINKSDLDLYLSFDNVKVGEMQAQFLLNKLPGGKGRIVRIYGSPTDNNAKLYKQGQDNILGPSIKRGDIKVVREDWAEDWKPENAKRIVNAAITDTSGAFDAVLSSNDGMAGGAIQALTEAGIAGKTLVTGQDAELAACQRIARGTQSMTIYKPLKVLASKAAEAAVALAKGKPIVATQSVNNGKIDVPSIFNPVFTVTKENLRQTVIKDGFLKEGDVFGAKAG
ncbi:xylose-binding protein [Abditibacterium utsteinense]|uniref:Xylose-binding protein n=1 Tax=Abditibacterium utsteinense TaxID=1960156 RepID=A0A2S8SW72_9BACT|nr:substrate-binding domain-containing protein [Abditibacterium utsteinense]PQV65038.1 xylose-binding protein [Abditibacterium utsteinense]